MSKITDCFLHDNTMGAVPLYDADKQVRTYYATRYGTSSQVGHEHVSVPLFPFSNVEVEDRCILLLLEAIKSVGWQSKRAYEHAEEEFIRRDLSLMRMLSSADHHLIPPGHRIAMAESEYLGKLVESGDQRGIVLFNSDAVIGYDNTRGRTVYEHLLQDYLAA